MKEIYVGRTIYQVSSNSQMDSLRNCRTVVENKPSILFLILILYSCFKKEFKFLISKVLKKFNRAAFYHIDFLCNNVSNKNFHCPIKDKSLIERFRLFFSTLSLYFIVQWVVKYYAVKS